jgi:SAM-dependent methyltransferase
VGDAETGLASAYDAIARLYDPWSRSVVEDVSFYVEEASRAAPGPIVELGVGTGRIAVPVAVAGISVIGVDSSAGMLDICREAGALAGVSGLLDLRLGDYSEPPVADAVSLVLCPFRAYLHLHSDEERLKALRAVRDLLVPGGRLVFDVFTPSAEDIEETHGRWLEREPGIFERADWDTARRVLTLSLRGPDGETTMELGWVSQAEWRALLHEARFTVDACYGWFDRRPWAGDEDSIWIATRPVVG